MIENTDLMHTVEEAKVLAAQVASKAGSLVHAKKQNRKYPNSQASKDYHGRALAEFLNAHTAYVSYVDENLIGQEHGKFDPFGLDVDEYLDA